MTNFLNSEELRGIADICEGLSGLESADVAFEATVKVFDSNGDVVGVIGPGSEWGAYVFTAGEQ